MMRDYIERVKSKDIRRLHNKSIFTIYNTSNKIINCTSFTLILVPSNITSPNQRTIFKGSRLKIKKKQLSKTVDNTLSILHIQFPRVVGQSKPIEKVERLLRTKTMLFNKKSTQHYEAGDNRNPSVTKVRIPLVNECFDRYKTSLDVLNKALFTKDDSDEYKNNLKNCGIQVKIPKQSLSVITNLRLDTNILSHKLKGAYRYNTTPKNKIIGIRKIKHNWYPFFNYIKAIDNTSGNYPAVSIREISKQYKIKISEHNRNKSYA